MNPYVSKSSISLGVMKILSRIITFLLISFLTVSTLHATWTKTTISSTAGSNTAVVAIGQGRNDGINRIYYSGNDWILKECQYSGGWTIYSTTGNGYYNIVVGKGRNDSTNRIYSFNCNEQTWSGSSYTTTSMATAIGPFCTRIGNGRNDGVQRIYDCSCYFNGVDEITYSAGTWTATSLGTLAGSSAQRCDIGAGRNDGKNYIYSVSVNEVAEFSYSGGIRTKTTLSTLASGRSVVVGNARNDGKNRVYVGDSNALHEYEYSAGVWIENTVLDTSSASRNDLCVGIGKNDGINRLYVADSDGVSQYSYSNGSWLKGQFSVGEYCNKIVIGNGRNDGTNRIYLATSGAGGNIYEYTYSAPDAVSVAITSPVNGSVQYGTMQVVASSFADNGIKKVEFYVDGNITFTDNYSPYSFNMDTRMYSNSTHVIKAIAYDNLLQTATTQITVSIKRLPVPSFVSPTNNAVISGTTNVTVSSTVDGTINYFDFYIDGQKEYTTSTSPYVWPLDTTKYADGTHSIQTYIYDSNGFAVNTSISVMIRNTPDSPPTINSVSLTNGQQITGSTSITVNATDDHGIVSVVFYVDSVQKLTDTSAPYTYTLDSSTLINGTHALRVAATDTVGQITTQDVSFTSVNTDSPPTINSTSIVAGQKITGSVTITISASDDKGVSKVEFYIDNVLKNTITSAPYIYPVAASLLSNGSHNFKTIVYDTILQTTQSNISFVVDNGPPVIQDSRIFSYPNPATGNALSFNVNVNQPADTEIIVYNIRGEQVADLTSTVSGGVDSTVNWDTTGIAPGVYVWKLKIGSQIKVRKLTIIK